MKAIPVLVGMCAVSTVAQDAVLLGGNLVPSPQLVELNRTTAQTSVLTPMSIGANGLAYDVDRDRLYAVNAGTEAVYVVDRQTGQATFLAQLPDENCNGLAVEAHTGRIFASSIEGDENLFAIDPDSGVVSLIGPFIGAQDIEGLAWATGSGTLYGIDDFSDQIVTIDTASGATMGMLNLPPANWRGLGYNADEHALYASVSLSGALYRIDLNDFTFAFVGVIGPAQAVQGLAVMSAGDACYADINGDGMLNILDFVDYQALFQNGDPTADCNDDGILNVLDFVCFQGAFVAGCD